MDGEGVELSGSEVRVEMQPHPTEGEREDVRLGFTAGKGGAAKAMREGQSWEEWKAEKRQWKAAKESQREAKRAKRRQWKESTAQAKAEPSSATASSSRP